MQRRLYLHIVGCNRLGDMLLVLLTLLGHVDHEIAENTRIAAQATTILEPVLRLLQQLGRGQFGEVFDARIDAVFGELTLLRQYLAFAALALAGNIEGAQATGKWVNKLKTVSPERQAKIIDMLQRMYVMYTCTLSVYRASDVRGLYTGASDVCKLSVNRG